MLETDHSRRSQKGDSRKTHGDERFRTYDLPRARRHMPLAGIMVSLVNGLPTMRGIIRSVRFAASPMVSVDVILHRTELALFTVSPEFGGRRSAYQPSPFRSGEILLKSGGFFRFWRLRRKRRVLLFSAAGQCSGNSLNDFICRNSVNLLDLIIGVWRSIIRTQLPKENDLDIR